MRSLEPYPALCYLCQGSILKLLTVRKLTLKERFLNLPTYYKLVGIGSFITCISVFLPWYQDIDAFNTGDQFLGITGPLYLIGYIIIALSVFSLLLAGFHFFHKKLPDLPMKEAYIYILGGAFILFLLIVTNSVYFHPKFGINITSKSYQIGMVLAFFGSAGILAGGVLKQRERGTIHQIKEFQEATQDPLDPVIDLDTMQKETEQHNNPQERNATETYTKPQSTPYNRPTFGGREYKSKTDTKTHVRQEPYPDPSAISRGRHQDRIGEYGYERQSHTENTTSADSTVNRD